MNAVQEKGVPSVNSISNITNEKKEEDNKEKKESFKHEENESKEIIENILKFSKRSEEKTKLPSQGSNLGKSIPKECIQRIQMRILRSRNTNELEKFDSMPKDPRESSESLTDQRVIQKKYCTNLKMKKTKVVT